MNASTGTPRLAIPSSIPAFWSTEQLVELNGSLEAQNRLLEARLADLHAGQGPSAEKAQSDLKHISLLISKLLAENQNIQSLLKTPHAVNMETQTISFQDMIQQEVDIHLQQLHLSNTVQLCIHQDNNKKLADHVAQQNNYILQLQTAISK
ncbi:hypothetical protein SS50377_28214 [Spironucleus salmonicida]|uniref:Uncharacterized protein n=1 Tax=Spironucleus salmonicida TaxID=348837 RepID=V6LUZ5_9EUKA|nr:hypothetical protein SS50377_28214 [Spironucleus salmonicida]|eukprot:EST48400.1 Hypothetical protein SS50377_11348 [Spironucleus salmonicida]